MKMRAIGAVVIALALMAVGASGAQAKLVKVTGSSTVAPSQAATQFLSNAGVSVSPVGSATSGPSGFSFPIVAGFGDTKTYNGLLAHSGGLKFSKGGKSVVLRRFVAVRAFKLTCCWRRSRAPAAAAATSSGRAPVRDQARPRALHGPWVKLRYPKAVKHVIKSVKRYCSQGKVIVLANLTQPRQVRRGQDRHAHR